jgi:hypothetical protein
MESAMHSFYGELTDWAEAGEKLEMRFATEWYQSEEFRPEVFTLTAQDVRNRREALSFLESLGAVNRNALLPRDTSAGSYEIEFDHYGTLRLEGGTFVVGFQPFSPNDYLRVISRLGDQLKADQAKLAQLHKHQATLQRLCADQLSRLETKRETHPIGSTARTLYDQQIAFINRVKERPANDA